jgi:16S rRNA (guanine527-N7)-methyltransferase
VNAPTDDLTAALAACRIELPDEQVAQVRRYCGLLWEWNAKLNLTRHTDYGKFVSRDVVDSLAFAEFLAPDEKILDVGTGGGVPGVLLAILRPDLRVWLSESVGKKARAVADIVERLGLNAPVLHGRAEDSLAKSEFNSLVVRAVGTLKTLLTWLRPHWERFDRLLVLKGPAWVEERGEARHYGLLHDLALRKLTSYPMPGTESESVLLQICPSNRLEEGKTCRLRRVE